ncbi:MAG: hypothetical protein AABY49_11185 [Planctomycetota bacterium]
MASCPKDLAGGQPSTVIGLLSKMVIRKFKPVPARMIVGLANGWPGRKPLLQI